MRTPTETSTPSRRRLPTDYRRLLGASTVSNLGDGVSQIAYPWLASAVTRSPLLIALVAVVQRLPWLLFTLPAGVVTDRADRRRLLRSMQWTRAALTGVVAVAVLAQGNDLPGPDVVHDAGGAVSTDLTLYLLVVAATLLLGTAEVLYDNTAQTFLPAIVPTEDLERANGRLWSAELVANSFVGPALGAALLTIGFVVPFAFDAGTFAVAAVLITLIRAGARPPANVAPTPPHRPPWRTEAAEGFRWLWNHDLLRPMAVVLGLLNALGMMTFAVLVLFAQEVLGTTPTEFAILSTGAAAGGVVGGWVAPALSRRLGPGRSLSLVLWGMSAAVGLIGVAGHWLVVWACFAATTLLGTVWNVITVSLRQTIIPDRLLGRVNSVYRFFAWGMMPIGSLLGGLVVVLVDAVGPRDLALRLPWLLAGAAHLLLLAFAAPRLTTERIEAARAAAPATHGA